jgi:hypothetical protein
MTLISRLSKLSDSSTDTPRTELATLIHQILREAETEYELLEDESADLNLTSDPSSAAVKSKIAKIGEDLKIARLQYRKAQLAAKHAAEAAAKADREALFGGAPTRAAGQKRRGAGGGGNEKVSQQDLLLSASTDVTAALRRTQQLMHGELSRSRFASETLAQGTEALRDLSQRYSAFDDVLGKSVALIRDLVKKNKSDRWYYEKAIQILVGTLIWIVVRRLFWGPIWLVVVWPLKTVWWVLASVVRMRGKADTMLVGNVPESVVGTPTTQIVMETHAGESPAPEITMQGTEVSEAPEAPSASADTQEEATAEQNDTGETLEPSLSEVVRKIIDGESTTIVQNTMSRRYEDEPEREMETAEPSTHDEL